MQQCPKLKNCPYFRGQNKTEDRLAKRLKDEYCLNSNYVNCARWIIDNRLGTEFIPKSLEPVQQERSLRIIKLCQRISA